jgi:peptidyl-prolyl cis-trans isomerase C
MVDQGALAAEARKQGLDKDPTVARSMQMAADRALQNALLRKEITPQISDAAVKAKYQQDYANKPGEEEVHARHILVASEDEAKKIIAQLQKGDDFAALAKAHSTDTGSQQNGGDLGWFKKGDMVPAFAEAAFSLKSGQVSPTPIHTQFGWHVIQVLETRNAPPPTLEEAQDQIRQQLISDGIQKAVAQAKADVKIETFNADGSPRRATDTAVPPSAPKP